MADYQEEDVASNALELLSATSTWMLVRHQWLINTMRCVLTGESSQPLDELYSFDKLVPKDLDMADHLIDRFTEIRVSLEDIWDETTKASHPMSGLTIFEQLNQYQSLAHQFMLASTEANQKLIHEFAMRDPLTGARTRLTLNACLLRELNRSKRYMAPCTIALLDQDNFKAVNDRWGHVVGDHVITEMVEIINANLRPTDKLFRFGGDEWLILMPSTSKDAANQAIDRMHEIYTNHEFKTKDGESIPLSFSYGVAESSHHKRIEEWISEADSQLYKNKNVN